MYIKTLKRYKTHKSKELREQIIREASGKIEQIVTCECRRKFMYHIKEDMMQEGYIIFLQYIEKVDTKKYKTEQIRAFLEDGLRKRIREKIGKYKRTQNRENTKGQEYLKRIPDKRENKTKQNDYIRRMIKQEIKKLDVKREYKTIYLDYLENYTPRRELEKKYIKTSGQIDYILDFVKKKLKKQLESQGITPKSVFIV